LEEKEIAVPAQFVHFHVKDAWLVRECKLRIEKYDHKEIERRATIARNQRLKLLQRHFVRMVCSHPIGQRHIFGELMASNTRKIINTKEGRNAFLRLTEHLKVAPQDAFENAASMVQRFAKLANTGDINILGQAAPVFRENIIKAVQNAATLDVRKQIAITTEVVRFLATATAQPIAHCIFTYTLMADATTRAVERQAMSPTNREDIPVTWDDLNFDDAQLQKALLHILVFLLEIDWCKQFEILEKEKLARAKA
jgi:hypothetical protein